MSRAYDAGNADGGASVTVDVMSLRRGETNPWAVVAFGTRASMRHPAPDARRVITTELGKLRTTIEFARRGMLSRADVTEACDAMVALVEAWSSVGRRSVQRDSGVTT